MSYVEHCKKHGQYHGELCGECFEELEKAYQEQEEELVATMVAFHGLKKENEQLKIAFNSIKFALTEIAIHTEGTLTVLNDIEDNQ